MIPAVHQQRTPANERTHLLLGDAGVARLAGAHVLVAGVGGVGGNCVEALARAGVGRLTLVDFDRVVASNCNRQVVALHSTLDRLKVEVMAERALDIQPGIVITCEARRLSPPRFRTFYPLTWTSCSTASMPSPPRWPCIGQPRIAASSWPVAWGRQRGSIRPRFSSPTSSRRTGAPWRLPCASWRDAGACRRGSVPSSHPNARSPIPCANSSRVQVPRRP